VPSRTSRSTDQSLAYNTLEKAERYDLGLFRLSQMVHALPHRTLILCNQDEVRRVYALCRREYFDEYILFWPMTHDTPRLPMAVHQALRQLAGAEAVPNAAAIAMQARRIGELEALLKQYVVAGDRHVELASCSLVKANKDIDSALDSLSLRLSEGELGSVVEVKDAAGFQREIERMKAEEIDRRFEGVAATVQEMRQWAGTLSARLAPQIESARALRAMAESVRPTVLVVDDDEFQHGLLRQLLVDVKLELVFVTSGVAAIAALCKRRPDLVLMDVDLPDTDGIETTRRIRSVQQFTNIPVIMITGNSEKGVVVESLKAGASDFVVKPCDRNSLIAKVHTFLSPQ
jgi:CheY-like chemotaxis protein